MTTTNETTRRIVHTWNGADIDATVSDPPMTTTTVDYACNPAITMRVYPGHIDGCAGIVVTTTDSADGTESWLASFVFPTTGDVTGSVAAAMRAAMSTVAAQSMYEMGYTDRHGRPGIHAFRAARR